MLWMLKKTGRPKFSEDKEIEVIAEVVVDGAQTFLQVATSCNVSSESVAWALKKHKFHLYKMQILQQLNEDDPDCRRNY